LTGAAGSCRCFQQKVHLTARESDRYHWPMHDAFALAAKNRRLAARIGACAMAIATTNCTTTTTGTRWRMRLGVVD
jgi:hypothetical protein